MALSNTVQLRDGMSNVLSRIASNLSAVNDRFDSKKIIFIRNV